MKLSLFLLVAFFNTALFAQTSTDKVGHTEVVDVAGATAKTLTSRAEAFMASKKIEARTMANTTTGIGTLIVNYTSVKKGAESGHVKFNVKITVKDGKYKMELSDFKHVGIQGKSTGGAIELDKPECGETQITAASWAKIKQDVPELLKTFVQDMKSKMANPVKAAPASNDF